MNSIGQLTIAIFYPVLILSLIHLVPVKEETIFMELVFLSMPDVDILRC
jgi:hypothetical protein